MTIARKATRAKNPTQADIIRILILQEKSDAEKRLKTVENNDNGSPASGQNKARLRGEVAILDVILRKVDRYLAGDINVLIR